MVDPAISIGVRRRPYRAAAPTVPLLSIASELAVLNGEAEPVARAIVVSNAPAEGIVGALSTLANTHPPDGAYSADAFPDRERNKYDSLLSSDLR